MLVTMGLSAKSGAVVVVSSVFKIGELGMYKIVDVDNVRIFTKISDKK